MKPRKYILDFRRAPGDVLMMTGLVRDLKAKFGDDVQVDVRTQFPAIWRHNPHLTKLGQKDKDVTYLHLGGNSDKAADRRAIAWSKKGRPMLHYAACFHKVFEERTKIHVPVTKAGGDLHFSEEEKTRPYIDGRYWIVVPGGKTDMTNKWWHTHRYQEAVDRLRGQGLRFVQEGATKPGHVHPPLRGVLNAVGRTSVRDLIVNCYHAEGIICGCTFQMHIAGALEKPCVVLLGGREEPWFEAYCDDYNGFGKQAAPTKVPHRVLHTVGLLNCCQQRGCWLRRVEKLADKNKEYNKNLCKRPKATSGLVTVPECMDMIQTDHVVEAVMSYYEDFTLDPIGTPSGKYATATPVPTPVTGDVAAADVVTRSTTPPVMPPPPTFLAQTEDMQTKKKPLPVPAAPTTVAAVQEKRDKSLSVMDHPQIGGKVTIFASLFGNFENYHRRCLDAILETVPAGRMDLRIICNQVGPATDAMIASMPASKVYRDSGDRRKYQAMRQAFHDAEHPIGTDWVIWFDDEAFPRHGRWLETLCKVITDQSPAEEVAMLGAKQMRSLKPLRGKDPRTWFQRGSWYTGRDFRDKLGNNAANGDRVHYITPNFFALRTAAITACNIPDVRLRQTGGGVVIGEQLHQGGFKAKQFSADGKFVYSVQAKDRGVRESAPWI